MKKPITKQSEKGQSLLELALVLVFLLILLAGVIDLGRMMYEYLTMRDAAQEGAGYAAVFPNDCAHIAARVMQNLPDDNYTVNIEIGGLDCAAASANDYASGKTAPDYGCAGKTATIIIDHTTEITMPFLGEFIPDGSVPMHVEIQDRIVRPACSSTP
jgi:Flp pilus assembly protein TadG